jgi:hypothetical protein
LVVPLLGVSGELVGEEGEAVTADPGIDEAHGLDPADLAEEALAGPEHDRKDDQSQLVGEVVLDQRTPELIAGGDDDFPVEVLLQLLRRGSSLPRSAEIARLEAGGRRRAGRAYRSCSRWLGG